MRYIWIDAICINQKDAEEKGLQLRLMAHIYGAAQTVVAWLGMADDSTNSVYDSMKVGRRRDPTAEDARAVLRFVQGRRYWKRVWIVQEISLARHLVFLCGSLQFSLYDVQSMVHDWGGGNYVLSDRQEIWELEDLSWTISALSIAWVPSLEKLWLSTKTQLCFNEKDHVYGILGMADSDLIKQYPSLTSNYDLPIADLFVAFTHIMLAEKGSLTAIGFASAGHAGDKAIPGLPSWFSNMAKGIFTTPSALLLQSSDVRDQERAFVRQVICSFLLTSSVTFRCSIVY